MPHTFSAYKRLTHRYNDAWRNEDQHEYTCEAKVVFGRGRYSSDDYDASYVTPAHVTFSKPMTFREAYNVLQNEYVKSCRCEHDCCGHYCGGVEWSSLRKAGRSGRKWDFRTSYSPNV